MENLVPDEEIDDVESVIDEHRPGELGFDHSMLKVLMIEFFRSVNVDFSAADSAKWRFIVQYLRGDLTPPTSAEIVKMSNDEQDTFQKWEDFQKESPAIDLNLNRTELAQKYAEEDTKKYIKPILTLEEIRRKVKKERLEPGEQAEPQPMEVEPEPEPEAEETTSTRRCTDWEPSSTESVEPWDLSEERKKRRITVVAWPCIVCQQRMKRTVERQLSYNDAFIIILICVLDGIHDMESAKKVTSFQKFKCCVHHLEEMYNKGRQHLKIKSDIDITAFNETIKTVLPQIIEIRKCRLLPGRVVNSTRRDSIHAFCTILRKFFKKFERQNPLSMTDS